MIGKGGANFRTPARRAEGSRRGGLGRRAMLCLRTLPFLFLLHTQLAKGLPVPPEILEEKNAKIVEVNKLSFMGDLLKATEFRR